jgi:hypothetical protein
MRGLTGKGGKFYLISEDHLARFLGHLMLSKSLLLSESSFCYLSEHKYAEKELRGVIFSVSFTK